jgi:hypothetical protein
MIYAVYYGYHNGQFDKLIAPVTGDKQFCGFDDMKGYPKMIFTEYASTSVTSILKSGVCVEKCPHDDKYKFADLKCKDNTKTKCAKLAKGPTGTARTPYPTVNFVNYCLPKSTKVFTPAEKKGLLAIKKAFMNSKAGTLFNDLYNASRAVYWSMALAAFWSLLFIYLMSIFAEPIAWCCVILVQLGLIGATVGSYFMWQEACDAKASNEKKAAK